MTFAVDRRAAANGDARAAAESLETVLARLLEPVVARAVASALAELEPAQRPALLTREQLATELGCCTRTIQRLEREGLPRVLVGDSPRYRLEAALAWLEFRSAEGVE